MDKNVFLEKFKKRSSLAWAILAPVPWTGGCVADTDVATIQGFTCLLQNLLRVVLVFAVVGVLVMVVVGGFQLITAGGEQAGIQKARDTLTNAVWGLVLAILVWFALVFISEFTGINVVNFEFPVQN